MNKQQYKVLYYNLDILINIINSTDKSNPIQQKYRIDLTEVLIKVIYDKLMKHPSTLESAQLRDVINKYSEFQLKNYPDIKHISIGDFAIFWSIDSFYNFKFNDDHIGVRSTNVHTYLKSLGFYFDHVNNTWKVKRMISMSTDNFDLDMFKMLIIEKFEMDKKASVL